MQSTGIALLCGAIGVSILHVFYRAIRLKWPTSYVTQTDRYGLIINRSVKRYLSFILLPVYFTSLLLSTMATREGAPGMLVAGMIGVGHSFLNHGIPMIKVLRYHKERSWPEVFLQLALAGSSVLAALLGGLGPGPFAFVVPPIDEFFKALWTAVFVAVLAVVVLNTTSRPHRGPGDLYDVAELAVPPDLRLYAMDEAARLEVDAELVLAIMYTENLQRPQWFRRLEYLKGKLFRKGSYGIMQITASEPISDEQSIDLAINTYLSKETTPYGISLDDAALRELLQKYNDNPTFVELARTMYYQLKGTWPK